MDNAEALDQSQSGLLQQVRKIVRKQQFNIRTEQTYQHWITQYIFFNDLKNPASLPENNVKEFLGYLANQIGLSRAKINQAKEALTFLYEKVLNQPLNFASERA
ncbi:site-specific integrase [Alkalimarinus alittae]|uniref:Phage integrase N-terminal SAM-like domain-containing protein n=1 Tax=Alkalimarinus alittae TaxID=2961619 RepID=A0ABY6N3J2_9ALTE|nr:site-specific integrase [Alkalimarinus alittae]UZE96572.1 phage integrase N-terminal SAM-like domain-containing protein [Alkalimarinus alittae]